MDERQWGSRWRRLLRPKPMFVLVVVLVVVGAAIWMVIPILQEFFKFERIYIISYQWTINASGSITQIMLRLRNNGTKTSRIAKVLINETLINSTEWGCRLSTKIVSKSMRWMYVAPESMVFLENLTYNIAIGTEAGNSFSYLIKVEDGDFIETENLKIAGGDFLDLTFLDGPKFASLYVETYGNFPVVVIKGTVNGVPFDLGETWVIPGRVGLEARAINFVFRWFSGVTYNFRLTTAAGNTYTYTMTAD